MYRHCFILIILFFNVVSFHSIASRDHASFAINLIHRDSPESSFYNQSSLTSSELLAKDVMRSHARVDGLNSSSAYMDESTVPSHQEKRKLLESEIRMNSRYNYLIKIYVGSNKVPSFLYVDPTTNFVWTKCELSEQRRVRYDPRLSSSFSKVESNSLFCAMLSDDIKVPGTSGDCLFKYKDTKRNSEAKGIIVKDTFYFSESQTHAQKVYFGCDNANRLNEYDKGVLGLGRGRMSFIWQLPDVTTRKFSYCLLSYSSKIIFGHLPNEIERILVSSPLPSIKGDSYYLNLEGVKVGDSPFEDFFIHIKIDFGKWTFLEESVYEHVENKVREIVKADPITPLDYGLCYKKRDLEGIEFPIVFHFERKASSRLATLGKASITINFQSVFAQENAQDDKHCMTIRKLGDGERYSVLGSLAQMGHVMQFDLTEGQVSFAQMDCSLF